MRVNAAQIATGTTTSGTPSEGGACVYAGGILREIDAGGGQIKLEYKSGRSTEWDLLRHAPDIFNHTRTFLCESGIVHWGNAPRAVNLEAKDNGLLAKLFGSASIHGAVVAAQTGNTQYQLARPIRWWSGGFQFYDTRTQTILRDVVFREFHADANPGMYNSWDNCALFSMNHSDQFTPQRMSATSGIYFGNVDESRRICHDDDRPTAARNFNFIDSDGTASEFAGDGLTGGPRLVGSAAVNTWNFSPSCVLNSAWGVRGCPLTSTRNVASVGTIPNAGVTVDMYTRGSRSRTRRGAAIRRARPSSRSIPGARRAFPRARRSCRRFRSCRSARTVTACAGTPEFLVSGFTAVRASISTGLLLCAAALAAAAPKTSLPDAALASLRGCWQVRGHTETWTFRKDGAHGLVVVRELGAGAAEAARARTPRSVRFDAKTRQYAFDSAGRIHALRMILSIKETAAGTTLEASVFSSRDQREFVFTGNRVTLERCRP